MNHAGFMPKGEMIPLWLVLCTAFLLRLFLSVLAFILHKDPSVFHSPDSATYLRPAMELLSAGQFAIHGNPMIFVPPGYSLFLTPGILLGRVEFVTIALQMVLSCFTVYIIYRISILLFEDLVRRRRDLAQGRTVFWRVESSRVASFCALAYAFEPLSVLYTAKLMPETLFTCFIVLFFYFLIKYLKGGAFRQLLFSSVILACSAYVKPIGYGLPVLVTAVLFVWLLRWKRRNIQCLSRICVFFIVSVGLVGLWQFRNRIEAGYSRFSAVFDQTLYFFHGASVLAAKEGVSYYEMQDSMGKRDKEIYFSKHPEQRDWSDAERFNFMREEGMKMIFGDFPLYLGIHLKGMLRTLLDPGAVEYLKLFRLYPERGGLLGVIVDEGLGKTVMRLFREKPLVFWSHLLLGLFGLLYLFLAAFAMFQKGLINNISVVFLLFVGVYFLILSGGPIGIARYRHPVMPIICILAGYGLFLLIDRLRDRIVQR